MNFKKILIRKIFSLKYKPKYDFSKKQVTPEEKLTSFIDDLIDRINHPKKNQSSFDQDFSKLSEIRMDIMNDSQNYIRETLKLDPEARLKAFKEKIEGRVNEMEKEMGGNKLSEKMEQKPKENKKTESPKTPKRKQEEDFEESDSEDLQEEINSKNKFDLDSLKLHENDENASLKGTKNPKNNSEEKGPTSKNEEVSGKESLKDQKKSEKNKEEPLFETSAKGLNYVPKNLVIKTLISPKTKSEVLLLGVERRNEMHASYMTDLLNSLKIDNIITQIAPDQPFFIKTEDNYKNAWEKFLRGKFEYKFVINPNPQTLADLVLDATRLKFLMDGSFLKSTEDFEMGSTFFYSKRASTEEKEVDCFLTPLLFSYNNSEKMIPLIINEFPTILYREHIARSITLKELLPLFESYIEELLKGNKNFDPCLLKPDIFIKPKIDYLTEVIKQTCFLGKKVVAVVDLNCAESIAETWLKSKTHTKIENLHMMLVDLPGPKKQEKNLTFTDYIQKHVILDLMMEDFVQENFVEFRSFPFSGKGTIGKELNFGNVFMIWNHYQRMYKKSRPQRRTLDDEFNNKSQAEEGEFVEVDNITKGFEEINKKISN